MAIIRRCTDLLPVPTRPGYWSHLSDEIMRVDLWSWSCCKILSLTITGIHYRKSSINPLPGGTYLFQARLRGEGLLRAVTPWIYRYGGSTVSILPEELGRKVEKLKQKTLEVLQRKIKTNMTFKHMNKSYQINPSFINLVVKNKEANIQASWPVFCDGTQRGKSRAGKMDPYAHLARVANQNTVGLTSSWPLTDSAI